MTSRLVVPQGALDRLVTYGAQTAVYQWIGYLDGGSKPYHHPSVHVHTHTHVHTKIAGIL